MPYNSDMSKHDDEIVGTRIWLDYYDQNEKFNDAFLPQLCEVVRRFNGAGGAKDWYLIRLEKSFKYDEAEYDHLMIRSRWVGCRISDERGTSVFIVLVPDPRKLRDPYKMENSLYIAWGMAYSEIDTGRQSSDERLRFKVMEEAIRYLLFEVWDPLGVNDLAPKDEYDLYIGEIYRLLADNPSADQVAEKLRQLEITKLANVTTPQHRQSVAEKLLEIDVAF